MQKLITRFGGFLVLIALALSYSSSAQNVQLQNSSFPSLPATSCTNTQLDVTALLLCINIAHNGNTFNISGSTITVNLDYSLGSICLGALSMQNYSIGLGMIPAGTYSVVINGVLNGSTVSTLNTSLVVNSCCSAVPSFTPSSNTICVGDSIYFNNTSTGANSQQWYENGVSVGSGTHYGKQYNSVGTYSIKLVVNGTGCSDSITQTVNVTAPPTVNLGQDISICPGGQTVLDAGAGRDSVKWSDQSAFRSLVVTAPGSYYVEVFENGCSDKDTVVVSFFNVQGVDLGNDTTICINDTLVLDATLAGATYQWQDNSSGNTFEVYNPGGTYYVERTDSNGCKDRDTITVNIDTNCNPNSVFESEKMNEILVYPNPVKNTLFLDVPVLGNRTHVLEIYNISGKLIERKEVQNDGLGRFQVDVSMMKSGIYVLQLYTEEDVFVARWFKE